jgi:hypothetical protein
VGKDVKVDGETRNTQSTQEEEAFERMDVDGQEAQRKDNGKEMTQKKKVPVLTVWMTRKQIPAFKSAFGEQTFSVQKILQEEG